MQAQPLLREVYRILKPEGRLATLIFAEDSPLIRGLSLMRGAYLTGFDELLAGRPSEHGPAVRVLPEQRVSELFARLRYYLDEEVASPIRRAALEERLRLLSQAYGFEPSAAASIDTIQLGTPPVCNPPRSAAELAATVERDGVRIAWLDAVCAMAFSVSAARQLCRQAEQIGFVDVYVVPYTVQSELVAYAFYAERGPVASS